LQVPQTAPSSTAFRPKNGGSWIQVLSRLNPQYGGIAISVPQLAVATEAQSRHECGIAAFCNQDEMIHLPMRQRQNVETFPPSGWQWVMDAGLRDRLKNTIRGASGVHIHGIWETHCLMTALAARACKRPYIISAHGMLEEWALRHKRLKKALYATLVETRNLQRAACLRALSIDEVNDYRRLGLTAPIALVPGGVDVDRTYSPELFWARYPHLRQKRVVLFLGRLHVKKGLNLLLESWAVVSKEARDLHLVIAGPDSEGTLASLERMVDELKLRSSVTFAGMLTGEHKWSALAAGSLFVLPSYSEGFSIAVLEALAARLPVLVTVPCHIPEVATHDCGWVIDPALQPLEHALQEFLSLSPSDATQMGTRGRELVRRRFAWSVVGSQMAQVYDWLQGGSKPSTVEIV
jgi:glycosyltransferase involved in cell wall biosynthesis